MRLAEEDYGVDDLLVSNDTLAFVVRSELELGASYTAQFVGCGVELEAEVEAASGGSALRFASNGVELPGLAAGATVSSEGHVIRFEYTVPSEAARTVLAVTLRGEAVRDDMQRALPSDVTFTRRVESPCGPAYLAALAANTEAEAGAGAGTGVCRCRRSSARCECQCGKLGASMEF